MAPMAALEQGAQSIDRAAQILVRLIESDEVLTLSGVMEETRLPKSTAARLLRALERNGLAQRQPGGGFRPGPVLVDYARRDTAVGDLAALALPFLQQLEEATGETSNIAIPTPAGVARLAQVQQHAPPEETGSAGESRRTRPRWARCSWPSAQRSPRTADCHASARTRSPASRELLAELEQVRRNGYATTWEELEAGLCSTAAPVRGTRGTVIAAISVSAPTVRTTRERLAVLTRHVVEAADALTDYICNHKHEGNNAQ